MTTDDEEGRKQVEAMTAAPNFKPGDWVRLKAGAQPMQVVRVEDYGNQIVCRLPGHLVPSPYYAGEATAVHSRASLVHCDAPVTD